MSSNRLRALEGMGYSRADEIKKKEEALELRRQQMAARTRMPDRERESAEMYEKGLQREADRKAFESAPKKGVMDELGDIVSDIFSGLGDDNSSSNSKSGSGGFMGRSSDYWSKRNRKGY